MPFFGEDSAVRNVFSPSIGEYNDLKIKCDNEIKDLKRIIREWENRYNLIMKWIEDHKDNIDWE